MVSVKIENYDDSNGYSADTFTFPYNPRVFDDVLTSNKELINIRFSKYHIYNTRGGINPKSLVLSGTLSSSSKHTNYGLLAKHIMEAKLKKVFFKSDRFYISLGDQIKQTNSGGRTNFLDYVSTINCPVGLAFSNTQKDDTYDGSNWSGGSVVNSGTTSTFIEKIVVTLDTSGSAADTVIIADNHDNGITVTLDAYSEDDTLTIYFITLIENIRIKSTKYWYCYQSSSGGASIIREITSTKNSLDLQLEPAENVNTLSFSGTANVKTYKVYFRDAYYS